MANTVSSVKRIRTTERKTAINRTRKSRLRHKIRSLRRLVAEKKSTEAVAALPSTFSMIDKAAKQGVIKKNAASRYKSRLSARVKAVTA
jgi:small subunit ribosomal protein S20